MLAKSLDDVETAFQRAVTDQPSALPFADVCVPRVRRLAGAPASASCRCSPVGARELRGRAADGELDAHADGCSRGSRRSRPLRRLRAAPPGDRAAPGSRRSTAWSANIFHGELSLGQMFHARPAAGYADLRTPFRGLYQAGSATRRQQGHRHPGPRRRPPGARRPPGRGDQRWTERRTAGGPRWPAVRFASGSRVTAGPGSRAGHRSGRRPRAEISRSDDRNGPCLALSLRPMQNWGIVVYSIIRTSPVVSPASGSGPAWEIASVITAAGAFEA